MRTATPPHVRRARKIFEATLGPRVVGCEALSNFADEVPILRLTWYLDAVRHELTIVEVEATTIALWLAAVLSGEPDTAALPVPEHTQAPWCPRTYRWSARAWATMKAASLEMAVEWAARLIKLGLKTVEQAAREGASRYAAPIDQVLAAVTAQRAMRRAGGSR